MPQSFASLHYHIIFSTKNHEPWITDDIREPLYETIGGILRAHEGTLLAAGGVADHIHLLAGIGNGWRSPMHRA